MKHKYIAININLILLTTRGNKLNYKTQYLQSHVIMLDINRMKTTVTEVRPELKENQLL